jgi:hypothetical protein
MEEKKKYRGNMNIVKHSWKKGQSGNPKGRPKSKLNQLRELMKIDDNHALPKAEAEALLRDIVALTPNQIKKLEGVKGDLPILLVGYLKGIMTDLKRGHTTTLREIQDRVDGKAMETSKLIGSGEGGAIQVEEKTNLDKMPIDDLKTLESILTKAQNAEQGGAT